MNRRARRVTLLTMAAGCLVLAGFVVCNWQTVRDHVDAWRFVCRTRTATTVPGQGVFDAHLSVLATASGWPVISRTDAPVTLLWPYEHLRGLSAGTVLDALRRYGYRIIEQRFPRQAYVVTGYPPLPVFESPQRLQGGATTTLELKAMPR